MHPRLTAGQVGLLDRHRRGLARLVGALSEKRRCKPGDLTFLVVHTSSKVGTAFGTCLDVPTTTGVIVIPGLRRDLQPLIERLALTGPVHDCTGGGAGVAVVIIDEHGEMALCRVECDGAP